MKKYSNDLIIRIYRDLFKIRRVEEEIIRIYPTDKIKSPVHLSIGQEAVSVGVCQVLKLEDVVFGTYRSHAMYIAKGGNLNEMIAELYGKITGCAKGKGGSMHLVDTKCGVMGTSAIVGTTIPLSVGYAYGLYYKGSDAIVVSFFGDGAVDEGAFHESMNFAGLKKLPVLFVCENNFYAIHSYHLKRHHSDNLCQRAESYGVPSKKIKGNNIFEIYDTVKEVSEDIRKGKGPFFIECETYRWKEHVGPGDDFHLGYRSEKEIDDWVKDDQLQNIRELINSEITQEIEASVEKEIKDAFSFAEQSSFPGYEELYTGVYKE